MHSDSKKQRSSFLVALLFAAGDAKRYKPKGNILMFRSIFRVVALLACVASFSSALADDKFESRKKLSELKIEYTKEAFVSSILKNDDIAAVLFLKAGMDPNYHATFNAAYDAILTDGLPPNDAHVVRQVIYSNNIMAVNQLIRRVPPDVEVRVLKASKYMFIKGTPLIG